MFGLGPNFAHLDGETKKILILESAEHFKSTGSLRISGLKGRDIPAQGNALGAR